MNEPAFLPLKKIVANQLDDGDGVLVDLETRQYYQLNETAMLIWRAVENGRNLDQIVEEIVAAYSISNDRALASAEALLTKLQNHKLIRPTL
ncbi:MAG TPA: PqqD family protein [Pyrinomonadaceae bacterium]|nr:PqqD family protein [Pyrinomonadaceae bacterium]